MLRVFAFLIALAALCAPAVAQRSLPATTDARLAFAFSDVHPDAVLSVALMRTLRVPDDGRSYPLPPGLGLFPAEHAAQGAVQTWLVPMLQSEALWVDFDGLYPMRVRILSGRIDAVSGASVDLLAGQIPSAVFPTDPQGYVVTPRQPWLDGFRTLEGHVRQWVAEPLRIGRTAEEQLGPDAAALGGLWIGVEPLRPEYYRPLPAVSRSAQSFAAPGVIGAQGLSSTMGLAAGGTIVQQIFTDDRPPAQWSGRVVWSRVEFLSSIEWMEHTGRVPPQRPLDAKTYTKHGYPWFTYWDQEHAALVGPSPFAALRTLAAWDGGSEPVIIPGSQIRDLSPPVLPSAVSPSH